MCVGNSGSKEFDVMSQLARLCCNLYAIFQGKDVSPPCMNHHNGHGKFIFRAHWLDSVNKAQTGLIIISIEHHEPQTLKILRAMQKLPLSPSQKRVTLLLAQGKSNEEISCQLHIIDPAL
jgi:hypothetical protein